MMKIGICDDEQIICEILKEKVEICLEENDIESYYLIINLVKKLRQIS